MLRKCYGYRGWRGTSSGEVLRRARGDARPDADPRADAGTGTLVYIHVCGRAGKLGAGSWQTKSWKLRTGKLLIQATNTKN